VQAARSSLLSRTVSDTHVMPAEDPQHGSADGQDWEGWQRSWHQPRRSSVLQPDKTIDVVRWLSESAASAEAPMTSSSDCNGFSSEDQHTFRRGTTKSVSDVGADGQLASYAAVFHQSVHSSEFAGSSVVSAEEYAERVEADANGDPWETGVLYYGHRSRRSSAASNEALSMSSNDSEWARREADVGWMLDLQSDSSAFDGQSASVISDDGSASSRGAHDGGSPRSLTNSSIHSFIGSVASGPCIGVRDYDDFAAATPSKSTNFRQSVGLRRMSTSSAHVTGGKSPTSRIRWLGRMPRRGQVQGAFLDLAESGYGHSRRRAKQATAAAAAGLPSSLGSRGRKQKAASAQQQASSQDSRHILRRAGGHTHTVRYATMDDSGVTSGRTRRARSLSLSGNAAPAMLLATPEVRDSSTAAAVLNESLLNSALRQSSERWVTLGDDVHLLADTKLSQELEKFSMGLRQQSLQLRAVREWAITAVTHCLQSVWPRARIEVFGSFATGLALPSSDIDLLVRLPIVHNLEPIEEAGILEGRNAVKESYIREAARRIATQSWLVTDSLKTIEGTKIPIITFKMMAPSGSDAVSLDVSFDAPEHRGMETVQLVHRLVSRFPMLATLALFLKRFLHDHTLDKPYTGGLSPYCLVLLITRFLQQQQPSSSGRLLLDFLHFVRSHARCSLARAFVRLTSYFHRCSMAWCLIRERWSSTSGPVPRPQPALHWSASARASLIPSHEVWTRSTSRIHLAQTTTSARVYSASTRCNACLRRPVPSSNRLCVA
jgi:hypothetical protein